MRIKSVTISAWIAMLLVGLAGTLSAQNNNLFVLAPSGLNLRESADPASKKIKTLPYGTKVVLLTASASNDLKIDNIPGGMAKVSANGVTGYIFDGYLSGFPAPTPEMSVEKYVELARKELQAVHFESHNYDYDGYYRQEDGVTLLKGDWPEAFLIGKMLGGIPDKINFPPLSDTKDKTYKNPDISDVAWSDEMLVERETNGEIRKISYHYRGEGSGSFVNIHYADDFDGMLIMVGSIAD